MLELQQFSIAFRRYQGLFRQAEVTRLQDISFTLQRGEVLAVIGCSGAGKSLLAHALLGVLPANASLRGVVRFEGQSLLGAYPSQLRGQRIALMPQQISHLDPLAPVGRQLGWAMRRSGRVQLSGQDPAQLFARLGLPASALQAYPHQLSGGMARRVLMALATAGRPDLSVADEPTAGLDPASRDMVLGLLRGQAKAGAKAGAGVMLISHDLAAVLPYADRVLVLNAGRMLGLEQAADFTASGARLQSDYARALWQALPQQGQAYA